MEDRRKFILLVVLCVALSIVVIALASALAAKKNLPPPPEPLENIQPEIDKDLTPSSNIPPPTSNIPSTSPGENTPTTSPENLEPWQQLRLPRQVLPYRYDIHVTPFLDTGLFNGQVEIDFSVVEETSYVIFNLVNLNVTTIKLTGKLNADEVELKSNFSYGENEVYVVESSRPMPQGNYTLSLEFKGTLIGSLVGFYRSSYVDSKDNVTRYLAATKFEPTYARRAFPCFDEPDLKATFRIRVTHKPEDFALSNMDVESITDSTTITGFKDTTFKESVKMSTYLVAFIVSQFDFAETEIRSGKPFRVYSRPDQINSTTYALDSGQKILDYYEQYFDIPYPLPKQDLIGLPDFVSGAMENWGLITFRETQLLLDTNKGSTYQKRSVARTIAHELTHQWFGNLVTMKWWDDLWLNEGFASFFAYEGMSQLEDDWKNWRKSAAFLIETLHISLQLDSNLNSHPIIQSVHHPNEITSLFDTISYKKGASIIRMLESFMGQDLFQQGLQQYLKKFAYGNAETQDLWRVMTIQKPEVNISKIMDTWTKQMGFPVIYVRKEGNTLIANQTRFLEDSTLTVNMSESPFKYQWEVPITYKIGAKGDVKTRLMHHMQPEIILEESNIAENELIKFNIDQTGVYRVNYDAKMWQQLTEAVCKEQSLSGLSVADSTNLFDDSYSLFCNGMLSPAVFLKLFSCLGNQQHYEMWTVASRSIISLSNLIKDSPAQSLLRDFALGIIQPVYDKIGWDDKTTYEEKKLQIEVLGFACAFQSVPCLKEATEKLKLWLSNSSSVSADLKNIALGYGLKGTGADLVTTWEEIWSRYLIESDATLKADLMMCLTTTLEPSLLRKLLQSVFDETKIRSQDAFNVIEFVSANPVGIFIAWHFFRENWERLVAKYSLNDRNLGNLAVSLTSGFTTNTSLSEMLIFFDKYPDAGAGERARKIAVNNVKANIKWIELRQSELLKELEQMSP